MVKAPRKTASVRHRATAEFWDAYDRLPAKVRKLAKKNFALLNRNSRHPSLHFKKVGTYWSARVGRDHRAVAAEADDGFVWFFIGTHADYDRLNS